jgi:superfamily II DNA or RNA helicase
MELKPHQKYVVEYMKKTKQRGIILYHGLGSGKTITAISIAETYNKNVFCIVPASMRTQWDIEIDKIGMNKSKFTIKSYEGFLKIIKKTPNFFKSKIVIVDEAHRLRGSGKIAKKTIRGLQMADKIIMLTGTPIVNSCLDLSPLINAITGKYSMPLKEKAFNKRFIRDDKLHKEPFKKIISNLISFYQPGESTDYPNVDKCLIKMKMSKDQYDVYMKACKQIPNSELHLMNQGKDIKKSINFNAFLNATRQVSNTFQSRTDTPKLSKILKYVKLYEKPVIIYSNFLDNGIRPMSKLLDEEDISFECFTGELDDMQKKQVVEKYNKRKIDVLLLSSSGGEGLDLKNTRQIHIMEPHWNDSKIDQVIGRGIRYKSHSELDEKDRHVKVYYWLSTPYYNDETKKDNKDKISADEYLYMLSEKKTEEIGKYLECVKDVCIEMIS